MKLKEFAKQLGLSPTTVSRALSGYPEVSEKTRKRVAEEAVRLGYRPNINAVRLVTGRAGAIGVVMGRNEFQFCEFMSGMAERLDSEDIDILVSPVAVQDTKAEIQLYSRLATSGRVDAVIVHSPKPNDERILLLHKLGIPFLVHGRSETNVPHAWLDIDNEGAIRRATSHLLDLGHRRIALINGRDGLTFTLHRDKGYREALEQRGIPFDPRLVAHGQFTDEIGFRFARSLLEQSPRPTAFVAGSMMTALGVYRAVRSFDLVVGRDISVIAHDDVFPYLTADNMVPSLSTSRSSLRAAGARLADLTLQLLAGRPASEIHELWPVELILRESTGPAAEAAQ
ncbi:transcriptional regulator [Sinorhizobium medicae]|uniref:Transcriptional regulator n=1 Tax=Sinorhizobium medicae TaxID=110321 RepID=A0A508X055_9HYPH|nr:substrate-binding domain-containing protein [Sinorhizobium medicae]MBO1942318.1 substrate-binding domain-containing protein [Sinorhizobium medicae]MDX0455096.1 LacI family DNA-binding transcriptional regulator [Sinorhizobium medicae]MDX0514388.1 LacI family DNA-binding transcriptional regulator [Sinorhizobium medicae]MDX0634593.1 LacI family DNA-binding transcriptional regulator [Sinorhizobium medicae]MDX0696135.1 LacI family DNA-binding transcriptional regulator [Sinorhizobium medicae]